MSKKTIKLHPLVFEKLGSQEKSHHIVRGKQMNEFKIGDTIQFKCKNKAKTRKIKGTEPVLIYNVENNFPLIAVGKGSLATKLAKSQAQNLAVREGYSGISELILALNLKPGQKSHCKILHFTDVKYL